MSGGSSFAHFIQTNRKAGLTPGSGFPVHYPFPHRLIQKAGRLGDNGRRFVAVSRFHGVQRLVYSSPHGAADRSVTLGPLN